MALLAVTMLVFSLRGEQSPAHDVRLDRLREVARQAAAGKTGERIVNIGKKDEIGEACWYFNNLLDQMETCFREQKTVMRMAGSAKYFRKAQPVGLHGGFRDFLDGSNESVGMLEANAVKEKDRQLVTQRAQDEFARLINTAAGGDFSQRMNEQDKEGVFKALAHDLNRLLETTERGLEEVVKVLRSVASGDLTHRVSADYDGIFAQLKEDTNATVNQLREVVGQIKDAVDAIGTAAK